MLQKLANLFRKKTDSPAKKGSVKHINYKRGFGFLNVEGMESEVFFHFSDAAGRLRRGDQVDFKLIKESRGWRATELKRQK